MAYPPTYADSLDLLKEAFKQYDFAGSKVTERRWGEFTYRVAVKVVRSFYVADGPENGWYCVALTPSGEVRTNKPPGAYTRQPIAGFTSDEQDAKEWVEDDDA